MFPGNGYIRVNDVLTNISYCLVEPVVNTTLGTAVVAGVQAVTPGSMESIYVGAMLIVGATPTQEVITVTAVTATTFTASFVNAHGAAETLVGATFPVNQTSNPFFTQTEVLGYVGQAQDDFLVRVQLNLAVARVNFGLAQQSQPMPADCIQIQRVQANGAALYEQAQTSMDLIQYTWNNQGFGQPRMWFEDKLAYMKFGIWPTPGNNVTTELVYVQRDTIVPAMNEGFLLPDPFLTYVKYGALASCFGKDGEQRDPGRARYCQQRFDNGVKIASQFLKEAMSKVMDMSGQEQG